jgi:hypothetical protein
MQQVKYFCPILRKVGGFSLNFHTSPPQYQISRKLVDGSRADKFGRKDMTKAIGPFRDYANGLKRTFLGLTRRTSFELQRTLLGGGWIFVVYGENFIKLVNGPAPDRI